MTDEITIYFFEFITIAWIFSLGACLGSFLNVVVYRLPLGLSLSHPPSRCPYCETPIQLRDNIPILGWIILRGRCRQCSSSISIRYPFIEALTASLFIYILYVDALSGGANIPLRETNYLIGVRWILWQTQWDLILLYSYHMFFLYVLLGSILMEYDHSRIPLNRLVTPTILLAIVLPCFYPSLYPVPASDNISLLLHEWTYPLTKSLTFSIGPFFTGMIGCITGILVGTVFLYSSQRINKPEYQTDFPVLYMICGSFLGWQSVLSISLIQIFAELFFHVIGGFVLPALKQFPRPIILLSATILHVTYWEKLSFIEWWPSYQSSIWKITAIALFIIMAIHVSQFFQAVKNKSVSGETL